MFLCEPTSSVGGNFMFYKHTVGKKLTWKYRKIFPDFISTAESETENRAKAAEIKLRTSSYLLSPHVLPGGQTLFHVLCRNSSGDGVSRGSFDG